MASIWLNSSKNIENIIRELHHECSVQELLMPTIQSADLWKKSERYSDYGKEMLKIKRQK